MNTTNLISIKTSSTDAMTEQALAMVSVDNKKADLFKSKLDEQLDKKRNEQIRSEKKLPQSGNELPKKKVAAEINKNTHQSENDESEHKTKADSLPAQKENVSEKDIENNRSEQTNGAVQANNTEQSNTTEQTTSSEAANSSKQLNTSVEDSKQEQSNVSELLVPDEAANGSELLNSPDTENLIREAEQTSTDIKSNEVIETQVTEAQTDAEHSLVSELNESELKHSMYVSPEGLVIDKKLQSEKTKNQFVSGNTSVSTNVISDATIKTTVGSANENKNETALTKSIADFQQYIDMSKKHSMAGESIASVKLFRQSMKADQLNAQVILSDSKLPAGQTQAQTLTQTTHVAAQSALLGKVNSSLTGLSQSLFQTSPSLEVKTGVGKAGWNKSFSNQIVMMANNGIQQATIKLNPKSLGPVEAMVKLSGETAVVNLSSMHLTTKDAMESAIPRLKEMLNENGFSRVDVNVSHQDKQQQEAALANNRDSQTGSNNEHGDSTMPGDEQLSVATLDSETDMNVSDLDAQGLKIVDYYA